jgi:hypothetical protein
MYKIELYKSIKILKALSTSLDQLQSERTQSSWSKELHYLNLSAVDFLTQRNA